MKTSVDFPPSLRSFSLHLRWRLDSGLHTRQIQKFLCEGSQPGSVSEVEYLPHVGCTGNVPRQWFKKGSHILGRLGSLSFWCFIVAILKVSASDCFDISLVDGGVGLILSRPFFQVSFWFREGYEGVRGYTIQLRLQWEQRFLSILAPTRATAHDTTWLIRASLRNQRQIGV